MTLTTTDLQQSFDRQLHEFGTRVTQVTVQDLERLPRGASRETWRVSCEVSGADGARTKDYVLRRDFPNGFSVCAVPLDFEFAVYARLKDAGIPAARALFFAEHGPGGLPFYIREHIAGDWQVPHFNDPDARYDELRIATSKEHLRALAAVHTCDWAALGFGEIMTAPPTPDLAARNTLQLYVNRLRTYTPVIDPVATMAIAQLAESAPATASSVGLCKGTNGLGEEIFRDSRIVALSDWELALIGDPAYDWAMIQALVPDIVRDGVTIWGEGRALDYYEAISGIRIDPSTIEWYRSLNDLIKYGYSYQALAATRSRSFPSARVAWVGSEVHYRSMVRLADRIGVEMR